MGGSATINGIEYPEFNNFYLVKFMLDNMEWMCAESAYQALKFSDLKHVERINSEKNIAMVLQLGHVSYVPVKNTTTSRTRMSKREKIKLMYRVNNAKFLQNQTDVLKKLIVSTGPIVFTGSSSFWNCWNARILERIRFENNVQVLRLKSPVDTNGNEILELNPEYPFLLEGIWTTLRKQFKLASTGELRSIVKNRIKDCKFKLLYPNHSSKRLLNSCISNLETMIYIQNIIS